MHAGAADSLPCGLVEIDRGGVIADANEMFASWTGRSVGDLVGHPISDFVSSEVKTAALSEPNLPALGFVAGPDGSAHPVLIESGATVDDRRLVVFFDATAQRGFADELNDRHALTRRTQDRLELVIASSIAFAAADDEHDLATVLVDTTARAFAAENAVVYLLDENNEFQHVAGVNPFGALQDIDNLTEQARMLPTVVKISGLDEARALSPSVARAFEASGVHAMIIAPLHQRDQPLGILGTFFHHPRQFDEQASPLADALAGQAGRAIANLRLRAQLQHAATHDETTGLPNRRLLEEHLETQMAVAEHFIGVLFVDLDGFKEVNDRLGHYAGDQLLREVGQRLQASVREEDLVARYGGDEFVIVCQVTAEDAVAEVAERIRNSIASRYALLPAELKLTASIGMSVSSPEQVSLGGDQLLRAADLAMYRAKLAGGNRLAVSDHDVPR